MRVGSLRDARVARIALALAVVAVVVAANQTRIRERSSRVLGTKFERCAVEDPSGSTSVGTGSRIVVAQRLTVGIKGGRPGAALAPPVKVTPGATDEVVPVAVSLGIRGSGARRIAVTMTVRNLSNCPVALSVGRVTASRAATPTTVVAVRFDGLDRVVVKAGGRTVGRAELPVRADGNWSIDGSTYADIGAAS